MRLEPAVEKPSGYGRLMRSLLAEPYRGKRMRMSARVRGRGITARDMWLRAQALGSPADGPGLGGGSGHVKFDFERRPCTVVFDVPERGCGSSSAWPDGRQLLLQGDLQ